MTISEMKRKQKKLGCRFHHQGTKHEIWENPKNGNQFPIGRHDSEEVSKGLYHAILREAGLE